jgi:hypothetical protein
MPGNLKVSALIIPRIAGTLSGGGQVGAVDPALRRPPAPERLHPRGDPAGWRPELVPTYPHAPHSIMPTDSFSPPCEAVAPRERGGSKGSRAGHACRHVASAGVFL